jgi:UDP-glucose 4-epimerase
MKKIKVLVTGGAGFIGSHVVDRLVERDIETHVLVSGFRSGKHPNIIHEEATVVKGDLRDSSDMGRATRNMDYVFHLGSVLSHYCEEFPQLTIETNVTGTWNLKKACFQNNVKRIVFASSYFVYGEPEPAPFPLTHVATPEGTRTQPKGLYGTTKLAAEKVLQMPHPFTVPYTILRLFNVYGPRQYPDSRYTSVVSTWILKALKKTPLEIHDDGTQQLDFIYVKDIAEAFVECMNQKKNEVFNVGSGTATSMNTLADLINRLTDNPAKSYYNPKHPAYFPYMRADTSKIQKKTNWKPKTSLENGLKETIEFYRGMI